MRNTRDFLQKLIYKRLCLLVGREVMNSLMLFGTREIERKTKVTSSSI